MWYSNLSIVEILEREINNLRHMVDSSRKALGEKRQKDGRREGKNVLKELFISLLFFLRGQEPWVAYSGRL